MVSGCRQTVFVSARRPRRSRQQHEARASPIDADLILFHYHFQLRSDFFSFELSVAIKAAFNQSSIQNIKISSVIALLARSCPASSADCNVSRGKRLEFQINAYFPLSAIRNALDSALATPTSADPSFNTRSERHRPSHCSSSASSLIKISSHSISFMMKRSFSRFVLSPNVSLLVQLVGLHIVLRNTHAIVTNGI